MGGGIDGRFAQLYPERPLISNLDSPAAVTTALLEFLADV